MLGAVRRRWATQLAKRTPQENAFLALIPVVGAATGLTAVGIAHVIAFLQNLCWGSGRNLLDAALAHPWNYRVLMLAAGGLVVGAIGWYFKVDTRGAGTASIVQSLALKGGYISVRQTVPRVVAGVVTVAAGGSLGREGPMSQMGGAVGSWLGRHFRLSAQQTRMLTCAAASAAIAAVYNAPIGGALLGMEVFIGSFALEVFGPVVIATVISTLIFRSAMGELPRFVIPDLLRESYRLVSGWELLGYLVLGILAGIASVIFVRALFVAEDAFGKMRLPKPLQPLVGMTLVGLIGIVYPHVFGNGYESVNKALHQEFAVQLMVLLLVAKLVATALTLGAGGAGGLFMPTVMIGALLGGAFGHEVHTWFPQQTAESGAYALVGMGGLLAGTMHAPLTAIMMVFEQTNSYQIILPLMFVCIISSVTARLFMAEPVHLQTLRRRGVVLPRGTEGMVMQTVRVGDVMHSEVEAVHATAPFAEVVDRFLASVQNHLYVINDAGRFLGAIPLHAIKGMLHQRDALTVVIAAELVDESFDFVTPEMRLADTMDLFWRRHCERLPVVDNPTDRRLIGWISKRDLIGVYNQEILQRRHLLARFASGERDERRDVFVELPEGYLLQSITVPPAYDGRTLGELALRSTYGVHALEVKRRDPQTGTTTVELATAQTRLAAGDQLIVIGSVVDIGRLMADLALALDLGTGTAKLSHE